MKKNSLHTLMQIIVVAFTLLLTLSFQVQAKTTSATGSAPKEEEPVKINMGFANLSKESATCALCHKEKTPGIYDQW